MGSTSSCGSWPDLEGGRSRGRIGDVAGQGSPTQGLRVGVTVTVAVPLAAP